MPEDGDEGQLIDELRRLEASARNYQQEVSQRQLTSSHLLSEWVADMQSTGSGLEQSSFLVIDLSWPIDWLFWTNSLKLKVKISSMAIVSNWLLLFDCE